MYFHDIYSFSEWLSLNLSNEYFPNLRTLGMLRRRSRCARSNKYASLLINSRYSIKFHGIFRGNEKNFHNNVTWSRDDVVYCTSNAPFLLSNTVDYSEIIREWTIEIIETNNNVNWLIEYGGLNSLYCSSIFAADGQTINQCICLCTNGQIKLCNICIPKYMEKRTLFDFISSTKLCAVIHHLKLGNQNIRPIAISAE